MKARNVDSPQQFRNEPAAQQQPLLPSGQNYIQVEYMEHRRMKMLAEACSFFSTVDKGTLYWFCRDFGETIHLKFKWREGPWQGYYEFWTCSFSTIHEGLHGLMDKVLDVEQGRRKPIYDKPYQA